MNLAQIRDAFRTLSGRYDLTDEDDSGIADLFINQGCKFLDRSTELQKTWATNFVFVDAGSWYAEFPFSRAVKEVWAINDLTVRWQLEKEKLQNIMSMYLTKQVSLLDRGSTLFYSPAITRQVPEGAVLDPDVSSFTDVLSSSGYGYNAIVIAPPPSGRLLLEVTGLFYSVELVDNDDENFWTTTHPLLLLKAVMREVEVFNRNSQGVKDWETAINTELHITNADLVEEIIAEVDQMEG